MVEVNWTADALRDLDEIGSYIALDSIRYAEITVEELFMSTEILETFPLSGRMVPEFKNETIREIIKGNFRIVYKIVNKIKLDIVTVHHSKRLLSSNLNLMDLLNEE